MERKRQSPIKLLNLWKQGSASPTVNEGINRYKPYVYFGKSNLFPELLRAMADNCAPLGASVEMMAQYIAGDGVAFLDKGGNRIEKAEAILRDQLLDHTTVHEFLYATALDIALTGTKRWDVDPNKRGDPIGKLYHVDVVRHRSGKKDSEGRVNEYFWSSDWEFATAKSTSALMGTPYELQRTVPFDWKNPSRKEKGTIYSFTYKQNRSYYGEPWWLPCLMDAEVWAKVPVFNRTQIDTGFRAGFHIHIFNQLDEAERIQLDEDFEAIFTGADGKTYVVTYGAEQEQAPQFTKLDRGDHAGELDDIREKAADVIYQTYGVPRELMNVPTPTGLGGRSLALEQEEQRFVRGKVSSLQRFITNDLADLMKMLVPEVDSCEIQQLSLIDADTDPEMARMSYLRSTTVNEHRLMQGKEPLEDEVGDMLLIEIGGKKDGA